MKAFRSLIFSLLSLSALSADFHTDVVQLQTTVSGQYTQLGEITLVGGSSCSDILQFNAAMENTIASIETITANLSTLSVTTADMDALDSLSLLVKNMASESQRLALELNNIESVADLFEYKAALTAMLQLSTDIGTMADRILEMADRILIMADNIGLMADRIIVTQQLQNANMALTQASIAQTQTNMVLLSGSLSTIAYNLTLAQIKTDSTLLEQEMAATPLNSDNAATMLVYFQTKTTLLLNQMTTLLFWMMDESAKGSHYINSDTLTLLGDLSAIHAALATAIDAYSSTISQIAPLMQTPILGDATKAMLQLSSDIKTMSDRIMVMTNNIYIMADNIGLMSDQIVLTQNLQKSNIDLAKTAILSSQEAMITIIQNFGL